ncbi:MAG TPA: reverse transcriptase family protein [Terriglobales bacterium]|nr:reverse transcriptase family protein [Terriglobales bacterium]
MLRSAFTFSMSSDRLRLQVLAKVFLSGELAPDAIVARGSRLFGKACPWLRAPARRFLKAVAGQATPGQQDVLKFLLRDAGFWRSWLKHRRRLSITQWLTEPQPMRPVSAAANWNLPGLESIGALAEWLNVSAAELEWFSELKGLDYRRDRSPASHYSYRVLTKKSGTVRLIESPKTRLKNLQRQILTQILDKIPPHQAAHGFVRGRSIRTCIEPHTARQVVLKMDLSNFFPTFRAARIQTLFRTLGYPEPVADRLGGICTHAVPFHIWKNKPIDVSAAHWREVRDVYARPHLPQGAPTSPTLANACCYRLDCRLTGLAMAAGADYTRYADDLAFSGDREFERSVERFATHVGAILLEEGFTVNFRKTRLMKKGVRQGLTGLVVNEHANVRRTDFDRLKAILTNCVRYGPESQNRVIPDSV